VHGELMSLGGYRGLIQASTVSEPPIRFDSNG
jgi:hypothetical protein